MEEGEFLASLVKSVQALCQGYVPFSSSIEVVGHLQLHIDRSLRLDCVLTEQVDRSPADHAPRFCSLSYLAKPPPAQHHSDSGHRTSGSSLPIDSVDRTSSSCLPIDSVDRTLGSSLPIDSVDRTSGSSLPIDSVDRTSGSSPPTDSVDRTVGSSPPIDSVDRNSGSSPPTDSASCVASSTSRRKTHQVPRIDDSESFNFTAVSQPSSVTQKKARSRGSEQVQRKDTPQSVQRKNVSQVVQRTDTSQIVLRTDVSQFVPRMDVSQFLPRTDMSQFVPRMDVSHDSDSHRITDQDPQQAVASLEPGSGDRGQKRSAAFLASPTKQRRLSADVKEEPEAELIYIKEEAESDNDAGTEDLPEQDPSPDLSRVTVESVDHSAQHEVSYMAGEDLHNTQPGDGTAFMAGDAAQTIQIQPYPVMLHAISKASLTAVAVPTPSSSTPTPVPSTSSGDNMDQMLADFAVEEGLDCWDIAAIHQIVEMKEESLGWDRNFSLHKYTDQQCKDHFRFFPQDIIRLCQLLRMPDRMTAVNRTSASGLEVLSIVLKRLSYPCRYMDLEGFFHRPRFEVCMLFNLGVNHIDGIFSERLTNPAQPWLTIAKLHEYSAAVYAKGAPLNLCWGFIDGTVRKMCKPQVHQREVYNGHKRVHALKFQSVVTPNGLIANLFGPMPGRRHDAALLNASGLMDYMEANMNTQDGRPFCVYGDPAYPLRPHLQRPHRGQRLTAAEQQHNTDMSRVRQAVEWQFGKIVSLWAFLDFANNLKLNLSPVGKLYRLGALLTNCHACLYGNQTSDYFGLNPPSLDEYLH